MTTQPEEIFTDVERKRLGRLVHAVGDDYIDVQTIPRYTMNIGNFYFASAMAIFMMILTIASPAVVGWKNELTSGKSLSRAPFDAMVEDIQDWQVDVFDYESKLREQYMGFSEETKSLASESEFIQDMLTRHPLSSRFNNTLTGMSFYVAFWVFVFLMCARPFMMTASVLRIDRGARRMFYRRELFYFLKSFSNYDDLQLRLGLPSSKEEIEASAAQSAKLSPHEPKLAARHERWLLNGWFYRFYPNTRKIKEPLSIRVLPTGRSSPKNPYMRSSRTVQRVPLGCAPATGVDDGALLQRFIRAFMNGQDLRDVLDHSGRLKGDTRRGLYSMNMWPIDAFPAKDNAISTYRVRYGRLPFGEI